MKLLNLALALGIVALGTKTLTRQQSSLKNRYESNYSATWNAINDLQSQFTPSQVTFLSRLHSLGPIATGLAFDGHSGNYWATGERDGFINPVINAYNNLATELVSQGYAT